MSLEELVVAQELALGRDLVTYWTTSWLVSNSPDWPFATGAPVQRYRGRGNDRGSPACLTSGGDFQLCGRHDTPVWCKTSDAIDCADWDQTTLCSADTLVEDFATGHAEQPANRQANPRTKAGLEPEQNGQGTREEN